MTKLSLSVAIFSSILMSESSFAAQWTKIDATTLRVDGELLPDELTHFKAAYQSSMKTVQLGNSEGNVPGALDVAQAILENQLDVEVVGSCLSSCANYLFLAGRHKAIRGGVVGFHGSPYASSLTTLIDWKIENYFWFMFQGYKPSEISRSNAIFESILRKEKAFFDTIKIDTTLFVNSLDYKRAEKIRDCSTRQQTLYSFPTIERLKSYGVTSLTGEQDWGSIKFFRGCVDAINDEDLENARRLMH